MQRWLLVFSACTAVAVACNRADRDIGGYETSSVAAVAGGQNEFEGDGGAGGAGGAGGGFAQGGAGGASFCDQPGSFCEDCAACLLQAGDCTQPLSDCDSQIECGTALQCLRDCRDGCAIDSPTCLEACNQQCAQSAPGYGDALGVLDCFCRLGCPNACAADFSSECISYLP